MRRMRGDFNKIFIMRNNQQQFHPQYITDEAGKRVAVVLPIAEYEELLEDLEDLAVAAARQNEELISHEKVVATLKEDGLLDE